MYVYTNVYLRLPTGDRTCKIKNFIPEILWLFVMIKSSRVLQVYSSSRVTSAILAAMSL